MITKIQLSQNTSNITAFTINRGTVKPQNPYSEFNLCDYTCDDAMHVLDCRMQLCMELGIDMDKLIMPRQTHTSNVVVIDDSFFEMDIDKQEQYLNNVDGLITNIKDVCIGVNTADCVPILLADPTKGIIAAIHAGWRGTANRIAQKAVDSMISMGTKATDILIGFGPSICPQCFEVGSEVVEQFRDNGFDVNNFTYIDSQSSRPHIDLIKANYTLLLEAGINEQSIAINAECTKCNPNKYFSARNLGIKSGRTFTGIIMK